MNKRTFTHIILTCALFACEVDDADYTFADDSTATGGDFADDGDSDDGDDVERALRITPRPIYGVGDLWGPCDLTGVNEPGWWGCDGELGFGLACLRPVSDNGLNICGPQTWDPEIADDCGNVNANFGLSVRVQSGSYCVVDCVFDSDCGPGRACSPASHFCAWIDQP